MNRLVCDTNVILSGFLWKGKPREILKRIETKTDALFVSRDLLDELERVLTYSKILKILKQSSVTSRDLLEWVIINSSLVVVRPLEKIIIKEDPSDDIVLSLQLNKYENIPILTVSDYVKFFP